MNLKTTVRWLVIAASGCYGFFTLVEGILRAVTRENAQWVGFWFFLVPFLFVYSGFFIAAAYFLFRRQYRHLCTLISALAALVVFGFLISLPKQFGFHEWLDTWIDSPWAFIGLPLSLAALLVPFYGARWVFRRGQAFLAHFIHGDTEWRMTKNLMPLLVVLIAMTIGCTSMRSNLWPTAEQREQWREEEEARKQQQAEDGAFASHLWRSLWGFGSWVH